MAKLLHPFWLELAGKNLLSLQKNPGCSSSVGVVNSACVSGCVECMECVDYHAQCVEVGRSALVCDLYHFSAISMFVMVDGGRWVVRYYILTVATLSGAHSFALQSGYDLPTVVNHIIIGQVVLLNLNNQSQGLMQGYNNGGGMRTGLNNNYVILTLHAYLSDHLACGTFLP